MMCWQNSGENEVFFMKVLTRKRFDSLSLVDQIEYITEMTEELRIYDPNLLSSKLKIQAGEIEAYYSLSQFDTDQIEDWLKKLNSNYPLLTFLGQQNEQYIDLVVENLASIDWKKPISSAQSIIEQHALSSHSLWDNLSYEYLEALSKQLKENKHGGNLYSAIKGGMRNGITSAQLNWFVGILANDYIPEKKTFITSIFTGGILASFHKDVELINRFCETQFTEIEADA